VVVVVGMAGIDASGLTAHQMPRPPIATANTPPQQPLGSTGCVCAERLWAAGRMAGRSRPLRWAGRVVACRRLPPVSPLTAGYAQQRAAGWVRTGRAASPSLAGPTNWRRMRTLDRKRPPPIVRLVLAKSLVVFAWSAVARCCTLSESGKSGLNRGAKIGRSGVEAGHRYPASIRSAFLAGTGRRVLRLSAAHRL
jgi:hypothetical protein